MNDIRMLSLALFCAVTLVACEPAADAPAIDRDASASVMTDVPSSSSDGPYLEFDEPSSEDGVEFDLNATASGGQVPSS